MTTKEPSKRRNPEWHRNLIFPNPSELEWVLRQLSRCPNNTGTKSAAHYSVQILRNISTLKLFPYTNSMATQHDTPAPSARD